MSSRAWSNVPIGIAAIAGLLLAAGPAAAQVQDQKLLVSAFIGDVCTVTGAVLDFGSGVSVAEDTDASSEIHISCAIETEVGVQLGGGGKPSGGAGNRTMTGDGADLFYILYKDAPGVTPWETDSEVTATIDGSGSVPVHGRIPQQQNGQAPGLHTDEVLITLNF